MPIEFVPLAKMPTSRRNRKSKVENSSEWADISKAIQKGLPKDTSIRLTLTDATKKLFKAGRAVPAFLIRLRKRYGMGFKIQIIQGEIYITKRASHIGNPELRVASSEPAISSIVQKSVGKLPENPEPKDSEQK